MSYQGISIREAIDSINNGWFLPALQRPYVWGSRHDNEIYICKLFDSLLKSYPIGGLIVWKTREKIPYREFEKHYKPGIYKELEDQGVHGRDKWLIYDGQQRLQTLYSCLNYTFNGKVLVFDMLHDPASNNDPEETGFTFVEKNSDLEPNVIRMNELFSKQPDDEKRIYRKEILSRIDEVTEKQEALVENNLDRLWDVFVKDGRDSLAYFEVNTSDSKVVDEIFIRLNTGGVALSLADILFSRIKANIPRFEEQLQEFSKDILGITGGYLFDAYNILQVIYLLEKRGVRVDPKKVKDNELGKFKTTWEKLEHPLQSFFSDYLYGQFKVNQSSIIPRHLALLPIVVYFYEIYSKGKTFRDIDSNNLTKINKYFIKSQINDWNLQSFIDNFSRIILEEAMACKGLFDFPLDKIESFVAASTRSKRDTDLLESTFVDYRWFALKVLTPARAYLFTPDYRGRFNPEIDHIFPQKLQGRDKTYEDAVDIIWNMQPMKGQINLFKSNIHPKLFFTNQATNKKGDQVVGSKYLSEYEFLFPVTQSGEIDFGDPIWDDPISFISKRREKMIDFLKTRYDLVLK